MRPPPEPAHLESRFGFLRDRARRSTEEVVAFIDAHRTWESGGLRWGVEPICETLQVAPSTYYSAKSRPPSARSVSDAILIPLLMALFVRNYSVYGRRKLTKAARKAELDVGRDQVARLMRQMGIRGASRAKKRFTTRPDPTHVRAPDLVRRDFTATRPDQIWVADFTYCSTWSGIVYVAFIVDVFSRRIVGWKAARTMHTSLVLDALNMAAWTRRGVNIGGVVCHSDAGSQYTSIAYTDRLDEIGAAPSIGTIGDSFDKGIVSHCTSWCWLGGNSLGEAASLTFDEAGFAGDGRVEEPGVAVVGLVAGEQAGSVPGLDGGWVHAEVLGEFGDGEQAA